MAVSSFISGDVYQLQKGNRGGRLSLNCHDVSVCVSLSLSHLLRSLCLFS